MTKCTFQINMIQIGWYELLYFIIFFVASSKTIHSSNVDSVPRLFLSKLPFNYFQKVHFQPNIIRIGWYGLLYFILILVVYSWTIHSKILILFLSCFSLNYDLIVVKKFIQDSIAQIGCTYCCISLYSL